MRRVVTIFLLLCATTHCVLSIFFVNLSYLDLGRYADGLERQPFQRRLLMVPFLHWAQSCAWLQHAAARFTLHLPQYEPMSAAKLACLLLGVLLLNALGLWTLRAAGRLGLRHDWLIWALLLVILYASYAARFEQALWYPYDLPHLVVFGAATLCVLLDEPLAFLACFAVDCALRETSVFLLPLALLLHMRSTTWRVVTAAGLVLWGASQWFGHHLYPLGAHQFNAVPWYRMAAPWHWPQLFSIVGFLWIPVWMARSHLSQTQRLALYAASAMMLLTFWFATWNESRAWSEWSVLFAALAALELEAGFARNRLAEAA